MPPNYSDVFRCKIEVQKAIDNLFREYDEFVFAPPVPVPKPVSCMITFILYINIYQKQASLGCSS